MRQDRSLASAGALNHPLSTSEQSSTSGLCFTVLAQPWLPWFPSPPLQALLVLTSFHFCCRRSQPSLSGTCGNSGFCSSFLLCLCCLCACLTTAMPSCFGRTGGFEGSTSFSIFSLTYFLSSFFWEWGNLEAISALRKQKRHRLWSTGSSSNHNGKFVHVRKQWNINVTRPPAPTYTR